MSNVNKSNKDYAAINLFMDIAKESINGMGVFDLDKGEHYVNTALLETAVTDVLESAGVPETEKEFQLTSALIVQTYLSTIQTIFIRSLE